MSGDSITILALWLRKLPYSDSGINFQRISTKLKFEPCESIRYLLSTNSFGFGTLRTSTHGHGCSKKLDTRQSKIHLISAKMIVETFQEYFSISSLVGGNTKRILTMFWSCRPIYVFKDINCRGSPIGLAGCRIWPFFAVIFGIWSEKRGGKRELQIRAGAGFCVFMGLGCEIRMGKRVGYGISILAWPHKLTRAKTASWEKSGQKRTFCAYSCVRFQVINRNGSVLSGSVKRIHYRLTTLVSWNCQVSVIIIKLIINLTN